MALTLRQLTSLVALADERNFGRAAARVHISQPALSMQMKELEAELGAILIERLPRDIRLTRTGREIEARARKILAEVAELEGAARRQGFARRLNIGVIPTVAPYLLPQALPDLRAQDLSLDLRIREAQTEVLMGDLDQGHLDAVVVAEPPADPSLTIRVLFEDQFLLAGNALTLAALPDPENLRPKALNPEHLLLLDEGHCLADQALEVCGLDRRRLRVDLGASSLSTLTGLVAQGFGLTFLPEIAVPHESAAQPAMALRRFADPPPARTIALVRRSSTTDGDWFDDLAASLAKA
ncbi:MAG: LysR substrate-binding domain-containing protein, partial [Deltaproteobacteria bacterium]